MITVNCDVSQVSATLWRIMSRIGAAGRHNLFSAAANAVSNLCKRHVAAEAPRRHISAGSLGAKPTGHLEKGARAIYFSASSDHGTVHLPIPGISRALHPLTISARNSRALTLPIHREAYGHRVSELRRLGWDIFRPKGHEVLMGTKNGNTVPLYILRTRVQQEQDRSLLPSDAEIGSAVAKAMMTELTRVARKAG